MSRLRFSPYVAAIATAVATVTACAREHATQDSGADAGTFQQTALPTEPTHDPETCEEALSNHSYVGCEYWPTVVANTVWSVFDFAVVVANAGTETAEVTVTGQGENQRVSLPGGRAANFYLPWNPELKGPDGNECLLASGMDHSVVSRNGAYHLVSTRPVIVYQFNPIEYQAARRNKDWSSCPAYTKTCALTGEATGCFSFSNDASLLLPTSALTKSYRVTGEHGWSESGTPILGPYVAVTATENATTVRVDLAARARVLAGGGVSASGGGGELSLTLDAGDVAEIVGDKGTSVDLSGSLVQADKPVQVIAGVPCINLPEGARSCDHLEETVQPVETLGRHYVVPRPTGPNGATAGHFVRLFGNADGTQLEYHPAPPKGCPMNLHAGEVAECGVVTQDFEVEGDHEFAVGIFLLGGSSVDPEPKLSESRGDPSQSIAVALEQYRTQYVLLAPLDYDVTYLDITGTSDAAPVLDGAPVDAPFLPIEASPFGVFRVKLSMKGGPVHTLVTQRPVGVQVTGYGVGASYQYPAGLNAKRIVAAPR